MEKRPRPSDDSTICWRRRRADIAERALPVYLEAPWPTVNIEDLAERIGYSHWQVYYSFDGRADIYRAAVGRLVKKVGARLSAAPQPCHSVQRAIRSYVEFAADIVRTQEYRSIIFLRLRDRHSEHWLGQEYRKAIANPLCEGLEAAVAAASASLGMEIMILHGAADRFLQKLESALALPALLDGDEAGEEHFRRTVNDVAKYLWSATQLYSDRGDGQASRPASFLAAG
jgi:AcrR family transcriptional regulator